MRGEKRAEVTEGKAEEEEEEEGAGVARVGEGEGTGRSMAWVSCGAAMAVSCTASAENGMRQVLSRYGYVSAQPVKSSVALARSAVLRREK
jgi:hypothetical protein